MAGCPWKVRRSKSRLHHSTLHNQTPAASYIHLLVFSSRLLAMAVIAWITQVETASRPGLFLACVRVKTVASIAPPATPSPPIPTRSRPSSTLPSSADSERHSLRTSNPQRPAQRACYKHQAQRAAFSPTCLCRFALYPSNGDSACSPLAHFSCPTWACAKLLRRYSWFSPA